ncbi:DUF4252 domain-containing protein [Tenacibaculum aquimarinum]|uniref:DUF4252 domain-containing protein n=1 Tax=Tenacibaculum aquimarinum TaxID=2910675 RepID=UPI001F0B5033|nr:DUF4252 domain-containing protein [Tenacibaculum aquimarinum]MCH3885238.1 DUF4252 domain-containing protein [Tenacibaculum aquimarinum]
MKKLSTILSFVAIVLLMSSCKKEQTLQSYLVESQDKKGFMTVDIPASVLKMSQGKDANADVKESLESIRKVNIVAMQYKGNEANYETEKNKLKAIFSNSSEYKSLVSFKDKRGNGKVFYSGDADAIDEIVAFGYSKDAGVGVARILGDNMNPGKIMEAMKHVNLDGDNASLSQFKMLLEAKE